VDLRTIFERGGLTVKLSRKEVEHVAMLARLALTGEEIDRFGAQLGSILAYAKKINSINTDGVEPTYHVLPIKNVWRKDERRPPLAQDDILGNAPRREGNYFRVPRIL
jgi:aspartyl-tRNA(Asn)/glutamyl-tRNA(Gln) amidotransferase subunit C